MIRWRALIGPIAVAAMATTFVRVEAWDSAKQALLVALSVIAAGVLVRLARGLPFTNPDHYEVHEIRQLSQAIDQILRSLRVLIILVLCSMILISFLMPIYEIIMSLELKTNHPERILSGLTGFSIGYIFSRMIQVVQGDYDLTRLQSEFIVRAVERKQAKRFDEIETKSSGKPFSSPEDFGRIVQ